MVATEDILPKQTLYIHNLDEKIGVQELKKCLYCMFTQFGQIADVQCCKTNKLRGQAWVVFSDVAAATNALQSMNGFPFFGKNLDIQYAKDESVTLKKTTEGWQSRKKQRTEKKAAPKQAATAAPAAEVAARTARIASPLSVLDEQVEANPPNKLLFVEGLPPDATSEMLNLIFSQYLGLLEVRMVDARPGIAFVEYDVEPSATTAMQGLQNFQITAGHTMHISYAK